MLKSRFLCLYVSITIRVVCDLVIVYAYDEAWNIIAKKIHHLSYNQWKPLMQGK